MNVTQTQSLHFLEVCEIKGSGKHLQGSEFRSTLTQLNDLLRFTPRGVQVISHTWWWCAARMGLLSWGALATEDRWSHTLEIGWGGFKDELTTLMVP